MKTIYFHDYQKTGDTGYTFKKGIKFSMIMDGTYINPISNYTYGIQVS